jgi:fibronectin type 3 domain-containing protein
MSHQAVLNWVAPTIGDPATSYNILRAAAQAGPFVSIGTSTTTSYTDTSVIAGTTYWYEVESVNSAGDSVPTAAVSATIPLAVPQAPSNLTVLAS